MKTYVKDLFRKSGIIEYLIAVLFKVHPGTHFVHTSLELKIPITNS